VPNLPIFVRLATDRAYTGGDCQEAQAIPARTPGQMRFLDRNISGYRRASETRGDTAVPLTQSRSAKRLLLGAPDDSNSTLVRGDKEILFPFALPLCCDPSGLWTERTQKLVENVGQVVGGDTVDYCPRFCS
jgi:hypothetical protein